MLGVLLLTTFTFCVSLRAQSVQTVAVGQFPIAIAVNPVTNKVYVANLFGNSLTVINGANLTTKLIPLGGSPAALAINLRLNTIYVACQQGSSPGFVSLLDGNSDAVTASVSVGPGPLAIAVNPVTAKVYVANQIDSTVSILSGRPPNIAVKTINVYSGSSAASPSALAVNPVTNRIYVVNNGSNEVREINGDYDLALVGYPVGSSPVALAVDTGSNKVYVANSDNLNSNGSVTVIDPVTQTTATIGMPGGPESIAVNPVLNKIYVTAYLIKSVLIIDGGTNTIRGQIITGQNPWNVIINPLTFEVYTSSIADNVVAGADGLIDPSGNVSVKYVPVGSAPGPIAINPVTNTIYVVNIGDGTVSVINGNTIGLPPTADGATVAW
jgi:YVTN family beta-propeller protein